jgi:hypothetical protein
LETLTTYTGWQREWKHQLLTKAGRGRNKDISSLHRLVEEGMETSPTVLAQVGRGSNGDTCHLHRVAEEGLETSAPGIGDISSLHRLAEEGIVASATYTG